MPKIRFTDDRDLGQHGKVSMGEERDDLPSDYAMLQVKYGWAEEVVETSPAAQGGSN